MVLVIVIAAMLWRVSALSIAARTDYRKTIPLRWLCRGSRLTPRMLVRRRWLLLLHTSAFLCREHRRAPGDSIDAINRASLLNSAKNFKIVVTCRDLFRKTRKAEGRGCWYSHQGTRIFRTIHETANVSALSSVGYRLWDVMWNSSSISSLSVLFNYESILRILLGRDERFVALEWASHFCEQSIIIDGK